jgi:hypothetical protein
VPIPPDPDPPSGNLAGLTPEQLAADRIAKYREVLEPNPDETPVTRSLTVVTESLQAIRRELRELRRAIEHRNREAEGQTESSPGETRNEPTA